MEGTTVEGETRRVEERTSSLYLRNSSTIAVDRHSREANLALMSICEKECAMQIRYIIIN